MNAVLLGDDVVGEAADIQVFLYQYAEAKGFDLHEATDMKMGVNRTRTWKIGGGGIGQHI